MVGTKEIRDSVAGFHSGVSTAALRWTCPREQVAKPLNTGILSRRTVVILAPDPPADWGVENIISTLQVCLEKSLSLICRTACFFAVHCRIPRKRFNCDRHVDRELQAVRF